MKPIQLHLIVESTAVDRTSETRKNFAFYLHMNLESKGLLVREVEMRRDDVYPDTDLTRTQEP